jgi:hypothetical protein
MLYYKDLSPAQRRWVELVEAYFPRSDPQITYAEIKQIHDFFVGKRREDARFKISKPLWLITNNALSRGRYLFPASSVPQCVAACLPPEEATYRQELAKFSIEI